MTFGINLGFGSGPKRIGIGDTVGLPTGLSGPSMGAHAPNAMTQALAARLGLGGLGAYQGTLGDLSGGPPATTPAAPSAPGGGGIGGWLSQHGDLLKGAGGLLQGGAAAYGAISQQQMERKRLQMEREREDRQRRDQEAGASAAAPGYAALLQALMQRLGPGAGASTGQGG